MKSWTSRRHQIGGTINRQVSVWRVLAWVIASLALTQLAHGLASDAIYLGGAGWFVVIPAEPVFQGVLVLISLLYLLGRRILAAVYAPTLHVLVAQNSNQDIPPRVACSFTPFAQSTIEDLTEEFFQEDCLRWGKEALWVEVTDGWTIAYAVGTAEIKISPLAFMQACCRQHHATKP